MHCVRDRAEALELGDALIDTRGPAARQPRPVGAHRHLVRGKLRNLDGDLVERQSDPLGEHDEGDPPQHRPRVAAVPGSRALGPDEAAFLVEPERRCRDAAAAGDLG